LPVEGRLPSLDGADAWLNSPPIASGDLHGKVVLVNFWTYSCINCLRTLPYLKAWESRYARDGLVVIGVHTPEFGFEHDVGNVKRAAADLSVRYPIAIDNGYRIWQAFGNQYWPAFYLADAQGRIRYHHFGEGEYETAEDAIRQLLGEAKGAASAPQRAKPDAAGALAAADQADIGSGETYLGYREATGFASPEEVRQDTAATYSIPQRLSLNTWALGGPWSIGAEAASASGAHAQIAYRFHARDLHLVLAPATDGRPIRFRIAIDGQPPGAAHGSDTTADGYGTVTAARLYQLVRQGDPVRTHTFTIEFFDPGVHAYTFTFG
jgi:thiol-disulfide isomerase/thioredoxin